MRAQTLILITLGTFSLCLIYILGSFLYSFVRYRIDPTMKEKTRRSVLHRTGRVAEGMILDLDDISIYYHYTVNGVPYSTAQNFSAIEICLPANRNLVIGEVSVVPSPSPASLAPPTSPASLAPAGVAPVLVAFPTILLGEGFRTNLTPNVFGALARSKDAPFGETHFLAENLNSIELSLPTRQQETAVSPAAYSSTDEMTDELFSLRDGALLENFGTAIGEADSVDESLNLELHHGERDSALSLWLLGILAGCVAGSAWLNRRKPQVALTPNLDPYSIPGR